MKQKFSRLLPAAVKSIRNRFGEQVYGVTTVKKPIPREYQGYISSFGASVMQMGLLPTLAVFGSQKEGGSKEDRSLLLDVLTDILTGKDSRLDDDMKSELKSTSSTESNRLFVYAIGISNNADKLRKLRANLMDAAVAAKLAIRTFKLSK